MPGWLQMVTTRRRNSFADKGFLTVRMTLAAQLPLSHQLSGDLTQLAAADYHFAERLPDGAVVVVGGNGSGAEIAEDLHLAGRSVHLSRNPAGSCFESVG